MSKRIEDCSAIVFRFADGQAIVLYWTSSIDAHVGDVGRETEELGLPKPSIGLWRFDGRLQVSHYGPYSPDEWEYIGKYRRLNAREFMALRAGKDPLQ